MNTIAKIEWLDSILRRIGNISAILRRRLLVKSEHVDIWFYRILPDMTK